MVALGNPCGKPRCQLANRPGPTAVSGAVHSEDSLSTGRTGRRHTPGMDRVELGIFLRTRREALRPVDVGLAPGPRRRTPGLRREEVALLADMSTDYYERLEQARGPHPSEQLIASIARALRLSADERDHLYTLAGHAPPAPAAVGPYIDPGLLFLLDALTTVPAVVTDDLTAVLAHNELGAAVLGDWVRLGGRESNMAWRWFTDPATRTRYEPAEHETLGRGFAADLRASLFRRDQDQEATALVTDLRRASPEFAGFWELREVAPLRSSRKTFLHPAAGALELQCDVVLSPDAYRRLIILRPQPGTAAADRLERLLPVFAS